MINLTVEAGNFAPPGRGLTDSIKTQAFLDFFRTHGYDAVTLASREVAEGLTVWQRAGEQGLPIVAANVFADAKAKKPLFKPWLVKRVDGRKLGVIGFVSRSAWDDLRDSTVQATWKSPFEMGKVVRKAAKKSDLLTALGEFTTSEAESLAKTFPELDFIVTTGIRADQTTQVGHTVISGSSSRGNIGAYVQFNPAPKDSVDYVNHTQPLDDSVPVDTSVIIMLTHVNEQIKAPAKATPAAPSTPAQH